MRDDDKKEEELLHQIRVLAGELGAISHKEQEGVSDAEHYDFQVLVGMANAAVHISGCDPRKLMYWLGYCFIDMGADPDDRIKALMDALRNEVEDRIDAHIAMDEDKD